MTLILQGAVKRTAKKLRSLKVPLAGKQDYNDNYDAWFIGFFL